MLVIISDLHLADGTTGETIRSGAFELFADRLRELAVQASYRADGRYRPIERLDVVLLGDIVDQIRSTDWTQEAEGDLNRVRPWDDPHSLPFIRKIEAITRKIMADKNNAASLAILKRLNDGKTITIPPATFSGEQATVPDEPDSPSRVPVNVGLHYVVGNHDWFFHLPGERYDALRQELIDAAGLSNPAYPFPHDINDDPYLKSLFEEHKVYARHGDVYDPFNYVPDQGRNGASLGDALVVELFNRFPEEIQRQLEGDLDPELLAAFRDLGNVRPSLIVPAWIDGLLEKYGTARVLEVRIKKIWDDLSDTLLSLDFVRDFDRPFKLDIVDALQGVLKLQKGFSFDFLSALTMKIQKRFWKGDVSFAQHAAMERAILTGRAEYVVYGHTHAYEVVPIDSKIREGRPVNQLYFNSGTWRPLHELGRFKPENKRFVKYKVMTMLVFYKGDERKGRRYEAWSGVLDAR